MVAAGQFREDLYYRLCQVRVLLPALDERREDIPLLVHHFLREIEKRTPVRGVTQEVLAFLRSCSFPGNIRQLKNIVESAAMVARTPELEMAHLSLFEDELSRRPLRDLRRENPAVHPEAAADQDERALLLSSLEQQDYNLSRTARMLGIALNTLKARMERLNIPRPTRLKDPMSAGHNQGICLGFDWDRSWSRSGFRCDRAGSSGFGVSAHPGQQLYYSDVR